MAHFAKIGIDNIVLEIMVVNNNDCMNAQGEELEEIGVEFLRNLTGHQTWKQTSYDGSFRKRYAAVGYTYNSVLDAFIPPKPYHSWILDTENATWKSPTPMPTEIGKTYTWNEQILSWQEYV
jgi:hypothetical protein